MRVAAVQSRVAATAVSWPIEPLPTSAFSAFHDGSYWCSKCPRRGVQSTKGLMRHITHHHTGWVMDEDTRALFMAIERVTCSTPSFGGLPRSGARVCNRCGQATQARHRAVGDIGMGPLGAPGAAAGVAGAEDGTAAPMPGSRVEFPQLQLPTNFTQRIRQLLANTLLHIPFQLPPAHDRRYSAVLAGRAWPVAASTLRYLRRGVRSSCWPRFL